MAVFGGRVEINGLAEAALLLDSHRAVHVDAVVLSVEIRQAPALLQLLTTATQAVDWTFVRDQKLRHLARLSCETDILLDVAVPLLKADPTSAVGGRLLTRYGWSLRRLGRKVDGVAGPFFAVAVKDSNFLRRHARHLDHETKGLQWLLDNVDAIERKLLNLKRTVVKIPDVGEPDGGGSDDDGDETDGGSDCDGK